MFVLSQSAFCGGKIDQRQACDMRDIEHVRMLLKMLEASRINLSLNLNRMEAPPVDMTYSYMFSVFIDRQYYSLLVLRQYDT